MPDVATLATAVAQNLTHTALAPASATPLGPPAPTGPHPLERALRLAPGQPLSPGFTQGWTAHTDAAYWNMNGPFGGLTAALLLKAGMRLFTPGMEPVALTVNFCAPMAPGPLALQGRVVRAGKSVAHHAMELLAVDGQGGQQVVASATLVGALRGHTFHHQVARMPQVPPPGQLLPYTADPRFAWLQAYEFHFAEGELAMGDSAAAPGAPAAAAAAAARSEPATAVVPSADAEPWRLPGVLGSAASRLWVRDQPARPLDHLSLAALCDVFFLRIFHLRRRLALAGTVTLTAHFHASADELARQGAQPLLGVADAARVARNFSDQSAQLWGADGTLLATSTQMAWFKE